MKITKELLKQIIKEEIAALNEKSLRPGEMTPEQESLRNKKVLQFLKDPAVQELQTKYGIFLSRVPPSLKTDDYALYDFFGLTVMQQNMKSPVRPVSDTIADLKREIEKLQQKK